MSVIAAAAGATGPPPVASITPFPKNKVNAGTPARIKGLVTSVADASTLKMKWSATRALVDPPGADHLQPGRVGAQHAGEPVGQHPLAAEGEFDHAAAAVEPEAGIGNVDDQARQREWLAGRWRQQPVQRAQ